MVLPDRVVVRKISRSGTDDMGDVKHSESIGEQQLSKIDYNNTYLPRKLWLTLHYVLEHRDDGSSTRSELMNRDRNIMTSTFMSVVFGGP